MECRLHNSPKDTGFLCKFNVHAVSEVFVVIGDEHGDWFPKELDVFIEAKKAWVHLPEAFKNKDVITDNYNIYIFEPETSEDKERGFTL